MPNIKDILAAQDRFVDSAVEAYQQRLAEIVSIAQARTLAELQRRLSITDGQIDRTAANTRVLRQLDQIFVAQMDAAGYQTLLTGYTASFEGTLPFVQDVIHWLGEQTKYGLPEIDFTPQQLQGLGAIKANARESLETVVEVAASQAKQRALFSVAGVRFADLAEIVATQLSKTVPQAAIIADTALVTFYRTATDQVFRRIEAESGVDEIRYEYAGPRDQLNRPFCRKLLELDKQGKTWTRAQIDAMDNGMLPNVMLTAGGYHCRHSWLLSLRGMREAGKSAA